MLPTLGGAEACSFPKQSLRCLPPLACFIPKQVEKAAEGAGWGRGCAASTGPCPAGGGAAGLLASGARGGGPSGAGRPGLWPCGPHSRSQPESPRTKDSILPSLATRERGLIAWGHWLPTVPYLERLSLLFPCLAPSVGPSRSHFLPRASLAMAGRVQARALPCSAARQDIGAAGSLSHGRC